MHFYFPPKFGNEIYGISTKWTVKNKTVWDAGQKLFGVAILIIGMLFFVMGNLKIREEIPSFVKVISVIALWGFSKIIIPKILEKKYPEI